MLVFKCAIGQRKRCHLNFFNTSHDWPDAACIKILSNVRKAMVPHSRLLVRESNLNKFMLSNFF